MTLTRPHVSVWCLAAGGVAVAAVVTFSAQSDVPATWNDRAAATYLDERQEWWTGWSTSARENDTYCISCHAGVPYALARPHLRRGSANVGPTPGERNLLANVAARVRTWNEIGPYYSDERNGAPKTSQSRGTEAVLNALVLSSYDAAAGTLTADTRSAFDHLWAQQEQSGELRGAWRWLNFGLQPWAWDDAPFFGAALAAVAVGSAPEGYASTPDVQPQLELLRGYFARHYAQQPLVNRVTLLWASTKVSGILDEERQVALISELLAQQREDGGWSLSSLGQWERRDGTTLDTKSDGYATGLVTYALKQAGLSADHDGVKRGVSWLLRHQDPTTGTWPGYSLNKERDPSTDTGRFMSDVATAYAVLALTE